MRTFSRRGQATAIGGVFLILLIVTLVGLFIYQLDYQHRYVTQSLETIEKREKMFNENIIINENYTVVKSYTASEVSAEMKIINGTLISGSNSSLINKGSDYIKIDSVAIINLTVPGGTTPITREIIRNGEFDEDFRYWNRYSRLGRWIIDTYSGDNAAVYYTYLPRRQKDKAMLSQDIAVNASPTSAKLSFKYRMTWWPWWLVPDGFIEVWLRNETWRSRIFGPQRLNSSWISPTISNLEISRGNYTLEFRVYVSNPSNWFSVSCRIWIDKVSLIIKYEEGLEEYRNVIYGVKTELDLDLPEYYNLSYKLLTKTSRSLILEVYIFDAENNVWRLQEKFITPSNEWFNLTFNSPKIIIYSESQNSFKVFFDYLYVETVELNPSKFILSIENVGSVEVEIVACWLKNETISAQRYDINREILPGEILEIEIPVVLTKGATYSIRVVTRSRVFQHSFTP